MTAHFPWYRQFNQKNCNTEIHDRSLPCTKGSERSCIYVLQFFWLNCLYQGKRAVMYFRVTVLLIELPVPREVSGHVFACYRSFDWSACTNGSERSCIYVLQVFWLKYLYQGKWAVMYYINTWPVTSLGTVTSIKRHATRKYMTSHFPWYRQSNQKTCNT
jgi:hypothetical protein